MLGIFLIYFIWKHYSELAVQYSKNKWGYGLSGIATYYLGTFAGGVVLALIDVFAGTHFAEESNQILLNLMALPFGLLFVWGLYKILESRWENQKLPESDSLDDGFIETGVSGNDQAV